MIVKVVVIILCVVSVGAPSLNSFLGILKMKAAMYRCGIKQINMEKQKTTKGVIYFRKLG